MFELGQPVRASSAVAGHVEPTDRSTSARQEVFQLCMFDLRSLNLFTVLETLLRSQRVTAAWHALFQMQAQLLNGRVCLPDGTQVPTSQENVVVFRILVLVFENEILSMSRRNGIMVPMFARRWCLVFANVCSVVMADVRLNIAHLLASNHRNIAPPLSRRRTLSLSLT